MRVIFYNGQVSITGQDVSEFSEADVEKVKKLFLNFKPALDDLFNLRVLTKNRIRDFLWQLEKSKKNAVEYIEKTHQKNRWNKEMTQDPAVFKKARNTLLELANYPYVYVEAVMKYYLDL